MNATIQNWPDAISEKKRCLIIQLIYNKIEDDEEREQWLDRISSATENDADEIVKSLLR
jgi:hypothetical protein